MNSDAATTTRRFRGSPRIRRVGAIILGALVAAYLVLITDSWVDQLVSPRRIGLLIALWVLGLTALVLLTRAYRHAGSDS